MIEEAAQDAADEKSQVRPEAPMSAHRDGFLVLGMHRSGTSAISGTLAKLGATPPKTLMEGHPDNLKGHWESLAITLMHDELLESAGSRWNDWRPFNLDWFDTPVAARFKERAKTLLASEFGEAPAFVLKDPRICRFLRFWLDIFAEEGITPRLILPVRQPLEVAQSLKERDGFSLSEGLLLWLRHVLDAHRTTNALPRVIVSWADFLADWRRETARIGGEFGVLWPRLSDVTAAEIDDFLTVELKHNNASIEVARAHPDMHAWVMAAYEALLELSLNTTSNGALATLDDIQARFEEASSLFGRATANRDRRLEGLQQELATEKQAREQSERENRHNAGALEQERARSVQMQQEHEATVSLLAEERQAHEQGLAQQRRLLEEEEARIRDLQRGHEDALAALQASSAAERQANEQELQQWMLKLEEERTRARDQQCGHDAALAAVQATLAAERQAHEQALQWSAP